MNETLTVHEQMLEKVRDYEQKAQNALRDAEVNFKKAESALYAIRQLRYELEAVVPKTQQSAEGVA